MNNINLNAKELYEKVEQNGLTQTLYSVFDRNAKITIPMSEYLYNTDLTELNFSLREFNILKRRNLSKLGEIVDMLENGYHPCVHNLNRINSSKIKTIILEYCYNQLSKNEKIAFFQEVINNNR